MTAGPPALDPVLPLVPALGPEEGCAGMAGILDPALDVIADALARAVTPAG